MHVLFVAGFSPIVRDPEASNELYAEHLGLPFDRSTGYPSLDGFDGAKHLGLWPLTAAAESCFGQPEWPAEVPIPQATLELEVDDVAAAAEELAARGLELIHGAKMEPWGQEIARLLDPNGLLVGVCHTPWLRGE